MGMGYESCFDYVVDLSAIKSVCPNEYDLLEKVMEKYGVNLDELAIAIQYDDQITSIDEEESEDVIATYEELVKKFKEKTNLNIVLSYHNQDDNGDRYDEVDGAFFNLIWGEILVFTPDMKKLVEQNSGNVGLRRWVMYG